MKTCPECGWPLPCDCEDVETILDACCGGRMFWKNKDHPQVLYVDNRTLPKGSFAKKWNPNFEINPDMIVDFREMPFKSESFHLVVFDPPHLLNGSMSGVINKKYGKLGKATWKDDLRKGFSECFRVLKFSGVLVFKWNTFGIPLKEVLNLCDHHPLFGDFTGKTGNTCWVVFMKFKPSPQTSEPPSTSKPPPASALPAH